MAGFKIADTRSTVLYHPRRVADGAQASDARDEFSIERRGGLLQTDPQERTQAHKASEFVQDHWPLAHKRNGKLFAHATT